MTTGFAVTAGWDLPVADPSHVHAAVAMADAAAAHAGLTPADRASCALIATELATNLARHARDGQLVASATEPGPAAWVQLAALDSGPGIPDVDAAMADGYSTANSLGGGLGACRRAAGVFDLYTAPARARPSSPASAPAAPSPRPASPAPQPLQPLQPHPGSAASWPPGRGSGRAVTPGACCGAPVRSPS